jgi:hypothetical protein
MFPWHKSHDEMDELPAGEVVMKVTQVQRNVMLGMLPSERQRSPRGSMERLEKKGLVEGNRRDGWKLTPRGRAYIHAKGIGDERAD